MLILVLPVCQAEDMIKEIKKAFEEHLPDVRWMDADTRERAIEKVGPIFHYTHTQRCCPLDCETFQCEQLLLQSSSFLWFETTT